MAASTGADLAAAAAAAASTAAEYDETAALFYDFSGTSAIPHGLLTPPCFPEHAGPNPASECRAGRAGASPSDRAGFAALEDSGFFSGFLYGGGGRGCGRPATADRKSDTHQVAARSPRVYGSSSSGEVPSPATSTFASCLKAADGRPQPDLGREGGADAGAVAGGEHADIVSGTSAAQPTSTLPPPPAGQEMLGAEQGAASDEASLASLEAGEAGEAPSIAGRQSASAACASPASEVLAPVLGVVAEKATPAAGDGMHPSPASQPSAKEADGEPGSADGARVELQPEMTTAQAAPSPLPPSSTPPQPSSPPATTPQPSSSPVAAPQPSSSPAAVPQPSSSPAVATSTSLAAVAAATAGKRFQREARAIVDSQQLTAEQKVKELFAKFIQQGVWARTMEKDVTQLQNKLAAAVRDREAAVAEGGKGALLRSKLEALCRELQAQNKALLAESKRIAEAEQRKRAELSEKFLASIKDVERRLEEQGDGRLTMLQENSRLAEQLAKLHERAELRETEWAQQLKKYALEQQMADLKLQRQEQLTSHEKVQKELLQEQLQQQRVESAALQQQMSEYCARFQECQETMAKSNEVMSSFKKESEKMAVRLRRMERENSELRTKCAKNDASLIQLLEERNTLKKQAETAGHQRDKLESLCRTLQEERRRLKEAAAVAAALPAVTTAATLPASQQSGADGGSSSNDKSSVVLSDGSSGSN